MPDEPGVETHAKGVRLQNRDMRHATVAVIAQLVRLARDLADCGRYTQPHIWSVDMGLYLEQARVLSGLREAEPFLKVAGEALDKAGFRPDPISLSDRTVGQLLRDCATVADRLATLTFDCECDDEVLYPHLKEDRRAARAKKAALMTKGTGKREKAKRFDFAALPPAVEAGC